MNRRAQDIIADLRALAAKETLDSTAVEKAFVSAKENGSHQIVPSLLPFIFPKEQNRLHRLLKRKADGKAESIQLTALRLADELLRNASVTHFPQLDVSIRATYSPYQYRPMGGWFEAHVTKLDKLECSTNERATALELLICHPSGFVREHALDVLAEESPAAAVPWAIIRANDWVAQIRRAARKVLHTALRSNELGAVAASAPLLERLSLWGRDNHAELESSLVSALLAEEGMRALLEHLRSSDGKVRRSLARLCRQLDDEQFSRIAELLIKDGDPGVRGVAAHNLERVGPRVQTFEKVLYEDRIATFNLLALESELRRDPEAAAARLPDLVFHRSSTVRYLARHRLTEREGLVDPRSHFAELYRSEALSDSKSSIAALGGLAEVGAKSDVATLAPLLESSRSKLVRATLKSMQKLDPIEASDHLKSTLGDSRPGVRHDALRLLRGGLTEGDKEIVLSISESSLAASDPKHVMNLARKLPYWVGVEASLRMATHARDELAELVREHLEKVSQHGQGQLPPQGASVQNLPHALTRAKDALPDELFQRLEQLELPFGGGRPFRTMPDAS